MTTVAIADLKASLSAYIARVASGEEVMLTDHGVPVAKLVPMPRASDAAAEIAELVRMGVVRPPLEPLSAKFLDELPRIEVPEGRIRAALDEERDGGW